jgi:hypothetical protein
MNIENCIDKRKIHMHSHILFEILIMFKKAYRKSDFCTQISGLDFSHTNSSIIQKFPGQPIHKLYSNKSSCAPVWIEFFYGKN